MAKSKRKASAAQLANQRRFAEMARSRARGGGGGSSVVVIEKGKSNGGGSRAALALTAVAVPAKAAFYAWNGRGPQHGKAPSADGGYVGAFRYPIPRQRAIVAANGFVYEMTGFWPGFTFKEDPGVGKWNGQGVGFDFMRPAENLLIAVGAKVGHKAAQKFGINRGMRAVQSWVGINRPVVV